MIPRNDAITNEINFVIHARCIKKKIIFHFLEHFSPFGTIPETERE